MSGDEPAAGPRVYRGDSGRVDSCARFSDRSAILLMDTVLYKIHATQSLSVTRREKDYYRHTIGYRIIDRATTALYGAIAEPLRHEDITPSGQELAQTAEDGEVPMGHRGAWVDGAQLVRLLEFDLDRRDAEAVAPDVVARAQGVLDVQRVEPEASCGWLALRGPLGWSRASAMLLPPPMGRHS